MLPGDRRSLQGAISVPTTTDVSMKPVFGQRVGPTSAYRSPLPS